MSKMQPLNLLPHDQHDSPIQWTERKKFINTIAFYQRTSINVYAEGFSYTNAILIYTRIGCLTHIISFYSTMMLSVTDQWVVICILRHWTFTSTYTADAFIEVDVCVRLLSYMQQALGSTVRWNLFLSKHSRCLQKRISKNYVYLYWNNWIKRE